jgi:hypothetical protein
MPEETINQPPDVIRINVTLRGEVKERFERRKHKEQLFQDATLAAKLIALELVRGEEPALLAQS